MKVIDLISLFIFAPLGLIAQVCFPYSAETRTIYLVNGSDTLKTLEHVDQIGTWHHGSLPFVRDSYIGLTDSNLSVILAPKYHLCGSELEYYNGLLKVSKGIAGVAFIDQNGSERFSLTHFCSCCFDNNWATGFKNGYSISYNGEWFITDTVGKTVRIHSEDTHFTTMDLEKHFHKQNVQGTVLFKTDENLYGIIMNGYVAIPPYYTQIIISQSASEGLQIQCKEERTGMKQFYWIVSSRDHVTKYNR